MEQLPLRILIAEDNEDVRSGIREHLEALGLLCREAENGLQALHSLTVNPVEVLLTDLGMPKMDGMELTETISHNSFYGKPLILVMSAGISEETRSMAYQAGAHAVLEKPFSISEILMAIQDHHDHLPQAA